MFRNSWVSRLYLFFMLSTSFTLNTLDTFHCALSSYQFLPWRQCKLWPVVTSLSESLSSLPLKDMAFAKAYMFASHTEDWVFEFQSRQFKTSETGSGSSRVKCSETVVNVTALLSWMAFKRVSCHYRCGTIKNFHWETAMNIAQFYLCLHRQWWRVHSRFFTLFTRLQLIWYI